MINIFSIDVEDWFHILDLPTTPKLAQWSKLESRVEQNFLSLLDLCDEFEVKSTCFFLGWIAKNYPNLVKEASKRGHEIASHGFAHELAYELKPNQFYEDITNTKKILEDLTGVSCVGYRVPGFSILEESRWVFEKLVEAGYEYSSSIFPGNRGHGGIDNSELFPHIIRTKSGKITEFPISLYSICNKKRICLSGGGYLRLFPYPMINYIAKKVTNENRPMIYYIHPREIDIEQPKLQMNLKRRFKSYYNIGSTKRKLEKIFRNDKITTFSNWISLYPDYDYKE
jgi:polysaccharide deacetylase family protein (PEP-CTERM system associated)